MASDQQVTSQIILQSLMQLQRQGSTKILTQLEQTEPDLASYLMENLSLIHQQLLKVGATPRQTQRLYRQIQELALVCIMALRQSHYELWRQTQVDGPLAKLDEPPEGPA